MQAPTSARLREFVRQLSLAAGHAHRYVAPAISAQPSSQTVCSGQSVSFTDRCHRHTLAELPVASQRHQHRRRDKPDLLHNGRSPRKCLRVHMLHLQLLRECHDNKCQPDREHHAIHHRKPRSSQCVPRQPNILLGCRDRGALAYQWRLGSVNIPGATASTYSIAAVGPPDLGDYTCVITNPCGNVTSTPAALILSSPPSISVYLSRRPPARTARPPFR